MSNAWIDVGGVVLCVLITIGFYVDDWVDKP